MRNYIFGMLSDLEKWSQHVQSAYERKDYQVGDYALLSMACAKEGNNEQSISFNKMLSLFTDPRHRFRNKGGQVTLEMVMCQVTKNDGKGNVTVSAIRPGETAPPTGPHQFTFDLKINKDIKRHIWRSPSFNVEHVNAEYVLGVITYATELFTVFIDIIIEIFANYLGDDDLKLASDQLYLICKQADPDRTSVVH